ncbi:MAG: hypothetical protein KBE16_01740 [Alphaproteobacteria bacterium]|jgi:hypothetical protein|nr:hypothetical protein [Alphaproteobacteria bacterium]MBP9876785.1 hypothetical protein [Alphaproteobacteria bacterium]
MCANQDNRFFYDLSPENFITECLAENAGLSNNIDIEFLFKFIDFEQSSCIIDCGAGEGRVVDYLLKNKSFHLISAVEYAASKISVLNAKFRQCEIVQIKHENILNFSEPHDYAILSFSFLLEFDKLEQDLLIKHLDKIISQKVFIDLPLFKGDQNGQYLSGQRMCLEENWGKTEGYFPQKYEILEYCENTDFKIETIELYRTDNGRIRELYVLSKNLPVDV